ncbi:hypothetical protein [Streptomyces sp. CBMA123]|uniref:hypothetical protein n=1 Tax=Streptomyces sp. CBMA123 TaxID=1896313 RepID=UPI001661D2F2|nr:hypothetical protein [Streptomyces sp. CBMA123]MBD0688317.1 hypothetical protein [Streptomyces sp. CBMA123]
MPPTASRDARVTHALDLLAPPGAVRTLLSVRLTERDAEDQQYLRNTLGDPADGMDPGEVAWHRDRLDQGGLLHTGAAGPEATPAAKELWSVFLAAYSWAVRYRRALATEQHTVVAVEEVLRLGAHPLTATVLDRLRDGAATREDLARPMTAAARAQLPDHLDVLVQQQLVDRLPDGALRTTPAGRALAGVHDDLASWYGQYLDAATAPATERAAAATARRAPHGSSSPSTPPENTGETHHRRHRAAPRH